MSQTEAWTVRRLLEWTTDFFEKKGIETPRLEAEILLADSMAFKRIELYTNFETEPTETQRTRFREFVKRRGAGEPVAYLVGFKEFFSIRFKVDRNVLIPRPETEQLVLEALDDLKVFPEAAIPRVCDIGTGSGAIVVALAKNWPKTLKVPAGDSKIVAVDLDPAALALAQENAQANHVADRIEWVHSDLLERVEGPFDLILSNPPYVSQPEYDALPVGIKDFEPKQALLAGPTGTEVIERLIRQAADKLTPGGRILIEASPMIAGAVAKLFDGWNEVRILTDQAGHQRFITAARSS